MALQLLIRKLPAANGRICLSHAKSYIFRARSFATKDRTDIKHKYANTLNLPTTDFPMRFSADTDRRIIRKSQDAFIQEENTSATKPLWVLHDGPPFANGPAHVGHALNKILKDIVNKFKLLQGYRVK